MDFLEIASDSSDHQKKSFGQVNWFDHPTTFVKKGLSSLSDLRICVEMKKRQGKTPLLLAVDQDEECFDEVVQSKPIKIGATKTFVRRAIQMEAMLPDITAMLDTLKIDAIEKPIFENYPKKNANI